MELVFMMFQIFLLVLALGIDAFICSFSYGANKINIPLKSVLMINVVTVILLLIGTLTARLLNPVIPSFVLDWLPFVILFCLGMSKIFEGLIKVFIRRRQEAGHLKGSSFNFGFILQVYADHEEADVDGSKELSMKEAIPLAIALGIDGLSVGFSIGLTAVTIPLLLGMSFVVEFVCVLLGVALGQKVAKKVKFNLSIFSGLILIGVALFGRLY